MFSFNPATKKVLNRVGAIGLAVSAVVFALGGGTADMASTISGLAIGVVSAVILVLKEVANN